MHLSIIIPAYNEEKRLPKTLREINNYLKSRNYDSEIIVVDGGSKDKTQDLVREAMLEIKNLKLIASQGGGKGAAVKTGMLAATGDFRIFTDADNSTSIDQVEKMWSWFQQGYDIVIGSRDIKGAVLNPPQPLNRRFMGEAFKIFRKVVVGLWDIEDTQCGFKCFTKKAAEFVFPKARIIDFSFDPEVLIIARKLGFKIKEMPIAWSNDPESKVKFSSTVEMAIDLLKIKSNLIKKIYG